MRTVKNYPEVAVATLEHLTYLVRRLTERVIEFSTLAVRNRIHAELLRLASERASNGTEVVIAPAPKHAEIASRVSTHREAVTRELNELARSGLVKRSENRLTICSLSDLRRLVEEVGSD